MAILRIIEAPDPELRKISKPVDGVDDELRALMDDMLATMYDAPGIGLAAIQVGVEKRVIVMDISDDDDKPLPRYFVNPEITWTSEEMTTYKEGCLSVPEQYADIERHAQCKVKYLDYDGNEQVLEADGLLSICIQHEMDHLEGILFIDHLSGLKRKMIVKKLTKAQKARATL
ncbi:MAG: peptide deformylase [Sphingomonadales bacterium]|nr:peptide deformylase [Sphingomonadales bacterium]